MGRRPAALALAVLLLAGCATQGPPRPPGGGLMVPPGGSTLRSWQGDAAESGQTPKNAAEPGAISPEPATPQALALRWPLGGDDNGNARVTVAYRKAGAADWRPASPLFWVHPARAPEYLLVPGGRLFAGSIVGLEPGTRYEVRLALDDPDGGSVTRTLNLTTTQEPVTPPGLDVRHVVPDAAGQPGTGSGGQDDPYVGLYQALAEARPGQILLLRAGLYHAAGAQPAASGEPGRPIILRGAGDGEVVLDGGGRRRLLDLSNRQHVWVERLTLRNADTLLWAEGASHLVIRRNRFIVARKKLAAGIEARHAKDRESQGFFITDNVMIGPNSWPRRSRRKTAEDFIFAIAITGAGHTVAYNLIRGMGDGINNGNGGWLSASDIHNNEIFDATDDCIEADHSTTNLRVFRNRLTNCRTGISAQPIRGGPAYVYRNLILNTWYSPFKLHNQTSGLLLFHNTALRAGIPFDIRPGGESVRDVVTRNNIFVGTGAPALQSKGSMWRCDFDNDGYAWGWGAFALWNGRSYGTPAATLGSDGLYAHAGAVTLSAGQLFASGLEAPGDISERIDPADNDPRLAIGSGALDQGQVLANFNDGFRGTAPDLGCCELGEKLPHFGPRPETAAP